MLFALHAAVAILNAEPDRVAESEHHVTSVARGNRSGVLQSALILMEKDSSPFCLAD